jgi:hypothetical protein
MKQRRIGFRVKHTGKSGYSEWLADSVIDQDRIDTWNEIDPGCYWWLEEQDTPEPQEQEQEQEQEQVAS